MTVYVAEYPANAASVMAGPLAYLLRGPTGLRETALTQLSAPMALYTLGVSDMIADPGLRQSRPTGWRFILLDAHDQAVAIGDARAPAGTQALKFDGLIHGNLAPRLLAANRLAQDRYGADESRYEVRVLEIPALYCVALWLHGDRDIFYPVLQGDGRDEQPVAHDPDFLIRIAREARASLAQTADRKPSRPPADIGRRAAGGHP